MIKKRGKALQGMWPGREAQMGLLCSGRPWLCVVGSGTGRDKAQHEEPGGPPEGSLLNLLSTREGF